MTREQFQMYLIWSGVEKDCDIYIIDVDISLILSNNSVMLTSYCNDYNEIKIYYKNNKFKEIFELVTGIKLVIEKPKPTIKEQLKDVKPGDFITFKDIFYSTIYKGIFLKIFSDHLSYSDGYGDTCSQYLPDVEEIISIRHNNLREFISVEEQKNISTKLKE
jgi:hypothetical protein